MAKKSLDRPLILYAFSSQAALSDCACADSTIDILLPSFGVPQNLSDCACSANFSSSQTIASKNLAFIYKPNLKQTRRHTLSEPQSDLVLKAAPGLHIQPLSPNHSVIFNTQKNSPVVVLNSTALDILKYFNMPKSLSDLRRKFFDHYCEEIVEAGYQLANLGFLQPSVVTLPISLPPAVTLTAWLHVTNACNLHCTYCYVNKTSEAMNEATGQAAIDAIVRSALKNNFKAIKLKYAGGESTLNFPLIQFLHHYAQEKTTVCGLHLEEVVLSNGVGLSGVMLDFMRDSSMRLMISLDGIGDGHDSQRIFQNGRGSANVVMRSIDRAIVYGVSPHISITITRNNAEAVAAAVSFALERNLFFNLNFYRDHDYGASHETLLAEDERLIAGVKAAFGVIEKKLPQQSLIAALIDRSNFSVPHEHSCGAGRSYLVVDHKGNIAGCQMEIERSVADIMADDPLKIIKLQSTGFQNTSVEDKEGCRECEWRYWCAGGCPLLTYRVTGRNDVKSPYCHVYKALFPELLRLEGLRLLKWADIPPQ